MSEADGAVPIAVPYLTALIVQSARLYAERIRLRVNGDGTVLVVMTGGRMVSAANAYTFTDERPVCAHCFVEQIIVLFTGEDWSPESYVVEYRARIRDGQAIEVRLYRLRQEWLPELVSVSAGHLWRTPYCKHHAQGAR